LKPRGERGSALIFVLYLLIILGVIAAEVARGARAEAGVVAGMRARSVGRYAAESGIAMATVRIHRVFDSATSVIDRVNAFRRLDADLARLEDSPLGAARFQVTVVNLNARLDLNRADQATLGEFFSQFTSRSKAEAIVAALKKEPIRRVGELARIPGMDESVAFAVAPYVTVWGDAMVDLNAAPESVLAALPGLGRSRAEAVVRRRERGDVFASPDPTWAAPATSGGSGDVPPASMPIPNVVTTPTRLLLISRGWQEGHPLTHEIQAAYAVLGQRLILQFWWERDL
jgi:type II secretory pathway component PulK